MSTEDIGNGMRTASKADSVMSIFMPAVLLVFSIAAVLFCLFLGICVAKMTTAAVVHGSAELIAMAVGCWTSFILAYRLYRTLGNINDARRSNASILWHLAGLGISILSFVGLCILYAVWYWFI